jgi:hypothetical protein
MPVESPRTVRNVVAGILTGAAAVATVIGAILAVLNQFGYLGNRQSAPLPTVIVITPVAAQSPAQLAFKQSGPQTAAPGATPAPHAIQHKPRKHPASTELAAIPAETPPLELPQETAAAGPNPNRLTTLTCAWRDSGIGACHQVVQTATISKSPTTIRSPVS